MFCSLCSVIRWFTLYVIVKGWGKCAQAIHGIKKNVPLNTSNS